MMSGLADSIVGIRAARLSRGLGSLGIGPGSEVVVLCCDHHRQDRAVALDALGALGAVAVEPVDWDASTLEAFARRRPVMELACREGVAAWRAVGGTGVMVADAEDALWWKAIECRHAAA